MNNGPKDAVPVPVPDVGGEVERVLTDDGRIDVRQMMRACLALAAGTLRGHVPGSRARVVQQSFRIMISASQAVRRDGGASAPMLTSGDEPEQATKGEA